MDEAAEPTSPPTEDLPLTMAASVILDHLPRDAHQALQSAGDDDIPVKGASLA